MSARLTVGDIRDMFKEFKDNDAVMFRIDEDVAETLKDSYRYEPYLGFPFKDNDGILICDIGSIYCR